MTSLAQTIANRLNAALSTGPRTPEGKARMAANPLKHGLTSKRVLVPGESPEEFDAMKDGLISDWQPVGAQEHQLVTEIAEQYWRLQRARNMETCTWEKSMESIENPDDADVTEHFHANTAKFDNLRRYTVTIERAWHRAIDQLRKTQIERRKREAEPKPLKIDWCGPVSAELPQLAEVAPAEPLAAAIGSVSQNATPAAAITSEPIGSVSQNPPALVAAQPRTPAHGQIRL